MSYGDFVLRDFVLRDFVLVVYVLWDFAIRDSVLDSLMICCNFLLAVKNSFYLL